MPRGANLHTPEQRAADDAKIRSRRHKYAIDPPKPEPEPPGEVEAGPNAIERMRGTDALRAVREQHWAVPLVAEDGTLVAEELPDSMVFPWEDRASVLARERPSYDDWRLIEIAGIAALVGPDKIPILLDD